MSVSITPEFDSLVPESSMDRRTFVATAIGAAIGTADLLGQMAADNYVDKLPILYSEFEEATRFSNDKTHFVSSFSSAADLIQRTPSFWSDFVRARLDVEFGGLYRFLNTPYPSGPNQYLEAISQNIQRLQGRTSSPGLPQE